MKLRPSEIFDSYAEIAQREGLVSEAEESNARRGSDDISTIEALYGVKPNGDEKDILDQAHPESVIISPAYDRLNGLVENLKERHNVMMGIVNKPHQAKLTQHRYAQQELFDELIRIGFNMDNKDQVQLSKLADSCAERLTKEAALPLALPIIGGVAAVLGVAAVINNFGAKIDQGVIKNCDRVEIALNEILQDKDHANLSGDISNWLRYVGYVKDLGIKAANTQLNPVNLDTASAMVNDPTLTSAKVVLDEYCIACEELAKRIPSYVKALQVAPNAESKSDSDWWAAIKTVWNKFSPEKTEYVSTALMTLQQSLLQSRSEIEKRKSAAKEYVQQNQEDIMAAVQKRMQLTPPTGPVPAKPKGMDLTPAKPKGMVV